MWAWTGLIRFRIRTSGGILWRRQWTFGFRKIWVISGLAKELSAFEEGLCAVELAAMCGCCIHRQQFGLSAENALNVHWTIQSDVWCSGQNVRSEMQLTAPTVTVRFTHRYILLSESNAVSPLRKLTWPRFAVWQAHFQRGDKRLTASSCTSVLPTAWKTRLLDHGFSWNSIFHYISKSCRENTSVIKV